MGAANQSSRGGCDDPIIKTLFANRKETDCYPIGNGPYGRGLMWTCRGRQVLTPQELFVIGTWRQTRLELEKEQIEMEFAANLSRQKLVAHMEQNPSVVLSAADATPVVAGRKRRRGQMWWEFDAECQRSFEEVTFVSASQQADRIASNTLKIDDKKSDTLVSVEAFAVADNETHTNLRMLCVVAGSNSPVVAGSTSPVVAGGTSPVAAGGTSPVVAGSISPADAGSTSPVVAGSTAPVVAGCFS